MTNYKEDEKDRTNKGYTTLEDIFISVGSKPFRVKTSNGVYLNIYGVTPRGEAVGCCDRGYTITRDSNSFFYKLDR